MRWDVGTGPDWDFGTGPDLRFFFSCPAFRVCSFVPPRPHGSELRRLALQDTAYAASFNPQLPVNLNSQYGSAAAMAPPGAALPIGWSWRRRALGLSVALVWSTALSQGLFYGEVPRSALIHFGPLTLWREGLWHGLAQFLASPR